MPIAVTKYIYNSSLKTSYIGLFNYRREARGKDDIGIDMYGLLYISSQVEIPGDKLAKFAWDGIVDGFEYSKTDSVNESLKLGLLESTKRVKQLIVNDSRIGKYGVDINFTVFVSNNRGIYIGVLGESDIFVYKGGRLVDLYEMLSSKKAKTAAIAMESGDLVFSSTKGYLKENMQRLIGTKDRTELISVLEELGKEITADVGLVVFTKEKGEKKEKESKKQVVEASTTLKETGFKKEPSNSDYIPLDRTPKKIFKQPSEEKDLREVFLRFFQSLSFVKVGVKKIFTFLEPLWNKIKKITSLVGKNTIFKIKGAVSSRLGKKRWFKKVSAKATQSGLSRRKESSFKAFRIDGYKQRNTRMYRIKILFFVVLGVSLLVGGIKFTIDQKQARERSRAANEIFASVEGLLNDANSKLGTDRSSATTFIYRASEELKNIPGELGEKDTLKLEELQGQVLGIEDSLFKRTRLSVSNGSIEKYYDTFNFNQDSKPDDIGIYRDGNGSEFLVITDLGTKSVYTISLYNKKVNNISDDNKVLEQPSKVYVRPKGVFVLDLGSGILKAEAVSGGFNSFVKLSGLSIQSIGANDIAEFAVLTDNENAYVLDREKRALLKATNFEGGYGLASVYLSKDIYEKANEVMSDLSVYILAEGENGVYRYVSSGGRMVESPVTLTGLDTPLKNAKYGYTIDNLNTGLYIFDSEDRRVLKFEKSVESGEVRHPNELLLLNQYVFEDADAWGSVKDIVVDYDEEYLYMLDGTTIWKIRL